MPKIERRFLPQNNTPVAIETRGEEHKVLVGYGAVFYREGDSGTEYELWSGVKERVAKSAFTRALKDQDDARGLFNHNPDNLLGRISSSTMRVSVDDIGLRYEIDIDPNDPDHQRVIAKVERGDITGSSFGFHPEIVMWSEQEDGSEVRLLESVELVDVGPVSFPAYKATSAGTRAEGDITEVRSEYDSWKSEQNTNAIEKRNRMRMIEIEEMERQDV